MFDLSTDPALARLYAHLFADKGRWPLKCEAHVLDALNTWVAFRESDSATIQRAASWDSRNGRQYRVDPLPERISDAWAAYLFGDDPRFTAASAGAVPDTGPVDQPLLDYLLDIGADGSANVMASELERAAGLASSEGEVWARLFVDPTVADRPMLEWHSRLHVIPLWIGPRLVAVALWTDLPKLPGADEEKEVFRHFELHAPGIAVNILFKGETNKLGVRVELEAHPLTTPLTEVWKHGLPGMLMQRVPNRLRGRVQLGISDYKGIRDYLLDLNEVVSIGAVNARLTARKRAVISAAAAQQNDRRAADREFPTPEEPGSNINTRIDYDPAESIYVEDPLELELGKGGGDPFRILEYSFDADGLIRWKQEIVDSAITRSGLVAQYVGTNDPAGYAISGTAIRLRLIPTEKAGRAKARYWNDALPRIIGNMIRLDALPTDNGGFGRPWQTIANPMMERRPGMPVDELEEAQRHGILISNGLESVATGVQELHPDWTSERVKAEVELIQKEQAAKTPGGTGSLFGV